MYDASRMARLKELIVKYGHNKKANNTIIDTRPASGMVGQRNCEGYIVDASGGFIRVESEPSTSEVVGPGSYDPHIPTTGKSVLIPRSGRSPLESRSRTPGPGRYNHEMEDTKIPHILQSSPPLPLPNTPLGYNLEHPSWLPRPVSRVPQAVHPETQFKKEICTHEFSSASDRELWPKKMRTPSPAAHAHQTPPVVYDEERFESPEFKSRFERFKNNQYDTPSPCQYTIPDQFAKSPSKKIMPPSKFKRPPPQPTPDATTYAPPIINKPDARRRSPQFIDRKGRFVDNRAQTPCCTKYYVDKGPLSHVNKRSIGKKIKRSCADWDVIPQSFTPGVGSYSPEQDSRPKSGYISTVGRKPFQPPPDRPLAFRTQHSSFIQTSYNSHYSNVKP